MNVHYTMLVEAAHVDLANRLAEVFFGDAGRNTWICALTAKGGATPTHWAGSGCVDSDFIALMQDTDRIEKAAMGKVPREEIDAMVKTSQFHQDVDPHALFTELGLGIPAEAVQEAAAVAMKAERARPAKYDLAAVPRYDPKAADEAPVKEAAPAPIKGARK